MLGKPPLRVISMAWGESFVRQFLEFCLPALLSPGNLPVLTEHFSTTLVFVTESRLFDMVRAHRGYADASRKCAVRLIALDDLVATKDAYGMSITYSLYRGFEDLGVAMTDCYQLFLNSDFILADDSYRGLLPYLLKGDRLILAPSYCANAEDVLPEILSTKSLQHGYMAIPRRKLAELVLKNRHLTIRAKTVNQRIYSANIVDQFYFAVDESTLLGYQLPVAVVAMKPEQQPPEINSYWDYGLIAEFCPSKNFTVLCDSDEFLMMELRERDRARGDVKLGWPSAKEVAYGLRNVATGYTVEAGRELLILHSKDLTEERIRNGREKLSQFFGEVVQHLRPFSNHLDHLQWVIHHPRFRKARIEFLEQAGYSPAEWGDNAAAEFKAQDGPTGIEGGISGGRSVEAEMRSLAEEFETEVAAIIPDRQTMSAFLSASVGSPDMFRQLGSIRCLLQKEFQGLAAAIEHINKDDRPVDAADKIKEIGHAISTMELTAGSIGFFIGQLLAFQVNSYKQELVKIQCELEATVNAQRELEATVNAQRKQLIATEQRDVLAAKPTLLAPRNGFARKVWKSLFGSAPHYKPAHWLYAATRGAVRIANAKIAQSPNILNVRGAEAINLAASVPCPKVVTIDIADLSALTKSFDVQQFDVCILETDIRDLSRFRDIFDSIRPHLSAGGELIGFFLNSQGQGVPFSPNYFDDSQLPVCGPMEITIESGYFAVAAMTAKRLFERALSFDNRSFALAGRAASIVLAAPVALCGALPVFSQPPDGADFPKRVASITIRIQIG